MVDCWNDFGQWNYNRFSFNNFDYSNAAKLIDRPFSSFAKFFDSCSLSSNIPYTLVRFFPFQTDVANGDPKYRNTYRWTGSFDLATFPTTGKATAPFD